MKKKIAIVLLLLAALALALSGCGQPAAAQPGQDGPEEAPAQPPADEAVDGPVVWVSICCQGDIVVAPETAVTVTDLDGDGALTMGDALAMAHDVFYQGEDGFASYIDEANGLGLAKLWGDDSGAFGYFLNNGPVMNLAEQVQDGDYVSAYVYSDTVYWSDIYTYFDQFRAAAELGGELTLTLSSLIYDADWNLQSAPYAGATVYVDGQDSGLVTDQAGQVTLTFETAGEHLVSVGSDSDVLVPASCAVRVTDPT